MRNDLPISPNKKFKYSISFESWDEYSLEVGETNDRGFVIEDTVEEIGDILLEANTTYGIYMPFAFGRWESTQPDEDADFYEKGIRKFYTLHITNEDGTEITDEENDFITFLLSDGRYEINKFRDYAVGGIVLGAIALGVGALITYFYFKDKKGNNSSFGNGYSNSNSRAKSVTRTINGVERTFPIKDAWKKEHTLENKGQDFEVPQGDRKPVKYEMGGDASEHYHEVEYGEGGVARAKDVIINKIGWNEEVADYLVSRSEKFAIWLADSILKKEISNRAGMDKKSFLGMYNSARYINGSYNSEIRQILDWLQHPVTPKQDLSNLSFDEALVKAREWHQELQVLGGDIDFVEPAENIIIKRYPKNSDGIEYYWVLIPSNFCSLESSRMGHCGRTGYGNNLISLRSIKPYGKGHTINDSHITIAYGSDGIFYQVKGKKNNKPAEKYFPLIFDLIKTMLVNSTSKSKIKVPSKYGDAVPLNFQGFGSEYDKEEDYGLGDMTNEQIRELYDLNPTIFEDAENTFIIFDKGIITEEELKEIIKNNTEFLSYKNQVKLFDRGIISEKPSTIIEVTRDCEDVKDLLNEDRDFRDDIIENVLCGDTNDLSDNWSYYYENPNDLIGNLNKENEQRVIDEIVRLTGLDESVVKENGIEYYIDGEDEEFDKDTFDNIIRAMASSQNDADRDDYYNYLYGRLKSSLQELGDVHELNDEGVKITIDLSSLISEEEIAEKMDYYEFSDVDDLFSELLANNELDLPNYSIDDRYSPYGSNSDFNAYFADSDLESGYEKGGSIRVNKNKKTKIKNMKPSQRKLEKGGALGVSKEDYYLVVNNWVYFTFNYPMGFVNDAFNSEHLRGKFSSSYERYGSVGAVMNFWANLDGGNQEILALWIKNNYFNSSSEKTKLQSISDENYANIITHWNMFCFNFPYKFYESVFDSKHFVEKWSMAYERAGATGVVNKFFTELSGDNQRKLTDWVYDNYEGSKFEEGGSVEEISLNDLRKKLGTKEKIVTSTEYINKGEKYIITWHENDLVLKRFVKADKFIGGKPDRYVTEAIIAKYEGGGSIDLSLKDKVKMFNYLDSENWTLESFMEKFNKTEDESDDIIDAWALSRGVREYADGGQVYVHKSNSDITLEFIENTNKGIKGLQKNPKSLSKKERKEGIIVYYSDSEMKQLFNKKYADGGRVKTNDGIIESFLMSDKQLKVGNLSTHFSEDENEVLLRNYGTLIATRKGNNVNITNTKYSKTTSTITNKVRNMAINNRMNVSYVDTFKKGGRLSDKATYLGKRDIESIKTVYGQTIDGEKLLDGNYVKGKINKPIMSRTQFEEETYEYAEGGLVVKNNSDLEEVAQYMTNAVKKHRWDLKDLIYYFEKDNNFDYKHRVKIYEDMNGYEMPKTYKNIYEMLKRITEANGQKFAEGGMTEGEEIYKIANEMTDSQYENKISKLNKEQKRTYDYLVRTGDSPKLALATVLVMKQPSYSDETIRAYTMADGGEIESFESKLKDALKVENKWHFFNEEIDGKSIQLKMFVGKKENDVQILKINGIDYTSGTSNYLGKRATLKTIMDAIEKSNKFADGGELEYEDREDFYEKNPSFPRRIEITKKQYNKNKDFISKQKWGRNIVDEDGYEDNNGVEFVEFDIEVGQKSSWDMYGWINENIPSSDRKIFVEDKKFLTYSDGGEAGIEYSDILNVLKSKIDDAIDEIPNNFENASSFTGEEVEHESRDGFIPYTDGGYEARWFEYLSGMFGSGYNLPTKPLNDEMERQINYNLKMAKDNFIENYPEIVEELGEENIDYNSLYDAGYGEEAEELSNDEGEMMSEDTIMMRIMAHYYSPDNQRAVDGKHTIRLFGDVNLESPYHRTGNLDDSYEFEFTFDSIDELETEMAIGIAKVIAWFEGGMYNDSDAEMKVRRMAKGGGVKGSFEVIFKSKIYSNLTEDNAYAKKDEIQKMYKLSDDDVNSQVLIIDKNEEGNYYAKGGGVKGMKIPKDAKIRINYVDVSVYKDSYEEGETDNVNNYDMNHVKGSIVSPKELVNFLSKNIYTSEDASDYSILDNNIFTSQLEDADGNKASEREIERWKKGDLELFSANFVISVSIISEINIDDETLSSITGIGLYKKGGKVGRKKSKKTQPKMVRQYFEDEAYSYAKGGGVKKISLLSLAGIADWKGQGIKTWYTKIGYPTDDLGEEINDTNTFRDLWDALHKKQDVYEIIGVRDSVVRERLFEYLCELYNVDYSYVYDKWLESNDEYARGGFVSKAELVWKKISSAEKMKFLSENFTPQITPKSQETLVGKAYNFLPKNVKITLASKYANVEEYAKGGGVDDSKYWICAEDKKGEIYIFNDGYYNTKAEAEKEFKNIVIPKTVNESTVRVEKVPTSPNWLVLLNNISSTYAEGGGVYEIEKLTKEDIDLDLSIEETVKIAKELAGILGSDYSVTESSVEEASFDLNYGNVEFDGGSYLVLKNGDIVNMAVPNKPVYYNYKTKTEYKNDYTYAKGGKVGKKKSKKVEPKVARTQFEEETYEYARGGNANDNTFVNVLSDYGFVEKRSSHGVRHFYNKAKDYYASLDEKQRRLDVYMDDDLVSKGRDYNGYSIQTLINFLNEKGFKSGHKYAEGGEAGRKSKKSAIKLYYHQTSGGAEYLSSSKVKGTKDEGSMDSEYIVRIDGAKDFGGELVIEEEKEEYAEGGEVSAWMEEALESLIEETGKEDLDITMVSNSGNEFFAGNDMEEYRVFKSEDDAELTAEDEVREDMEYMPENFNKDFIKPYIDGTDFFREALREMNESYANDIESEDDNIYANRLIAEMVENGFISDDDALSGNAEELAEYYKDDFVTLMTEEQMEEGNDGLDYFISNFGEEQAMKMVIDNNLIDIFKASKDAVKTDGIAHFLSRYDGETLYLSDGYVAYRIN